MLVIDSDNRELESLFGPISKPHSYILNRLLFGFISNRRTNFFEVVLNQFLENIYSLMSVNIILMRSVSITYYCFYSIFKFLKFRRFNIIAQICHYSCLSFNFLLYCWYCFYNNISCCCILRTCI